MRIKPSTSFPHPILAESTGDYRGRTFQLSLEVEEAAAAGSVALMGELTLDEPFIRHLIESSKAVMGLMITCNDTYLDVFHKCEIGHIRVDLSGGQVRGPVYVRGVVLSSQANLPLDSESISDEFLPEARIVGRGDCLAFTEEQRFEAGLEKLTPLESIFLLKLQEDVTEGFFVIDLEREAIEILVAPSLHQFLSLMRVHSMKDTLLSALYLPVVMSVLEAMRDEEGYADRRWYNVMNARCQAEGIDFKQADLARSAQTLLDAPLAGLQKVFEGMSK